jgi:HEAT repeat protein
VGDLETLIGELTSDDDSRAARALAQLPQHGDSALEYLLKLLESGEDDHRWWAAAALGSISGNAARDALIQALDDTDAGVRQCAVAALRQQADPASAPALIELLGDQDRLLARLASGALASIGSEAISTLTLAMRSDDAQTRIEAARALGDCDDPTAVPALFAALNDPSAVVVHLAEMGLERLGVGMQFFEV